MTVNIIVPKKLIEVALPLDDINEATVREKSIRHGHPSTLHLWWARRPLAAARAVLFGQLVNDPSWRWELEHPGKAPPSYQKAAWAKSRKRIFGIISDLVKWENGDDSSVVERARAEVKKSWEETCAVNKDHPQAHELFNPEELPGFHDPFAGGGAIPLEAQRLGMKAYASDLNPVAVLLNRATIELPSRFADAAPINPEARSRPSMLRGGYTKAQGLAEDVRYYGEWIRRKAEERVGHLYPKVMITPEAVDQQPHLAPLLNQKFTVISWLWARTVKSPNPAFRDVHVPLVSTFTVSSKAGKEAFVEPVIDGSAYHFTARKGITPAELKSGTKASRGNFRCLLSGAPISGDYIKQESKAGRLGSRMMAIVADGPKGRIFLPPSAEQEAIARSANPQWRPDLIISGSTQYLGCKPYGMDNFGQLFTERQLASLCAFSDLATAVRSVIENDAKTAGAHELTEGEFTYADSVALYLAFLVSQVANHGSTLCGWNHPNTQMRSVFSRQALSMTWDFAEANVFSSSSGSFNNLFERQVKAFSMLGHRPVGVVQQANASTQEISSMKVVSTDPPYYDNVPYADLSDFFYVWLRRTLAGMHLPELSTLSVPKAEELVAFAYRHGSKSGAEAFFLNGMTQAMTNIARLAHPAVPVTIYYAFKQAETEDTLGTTSTGWVTFLEAVVRAGYCLTGTWPMRTEKEGRARGNSSNALASSIILVCRPRPVNAPSTSRRSFIRELNARLPEALDGMTRGTGDDASPVAPVDLSQAIIGPGMAIFSKYAAVLEADGTPMTVSAALRLINRYLAEDDFDAETHFCLTWYQQHGWSAGRFGDADQLARAKGTAVNGLVQAGVVEASGGLVRLLKWTDYPDPWRPESDLKMPVWEALHHLIRLFQTGGEAGAGAVLGSLQGIKDAVRQLAYRLYTLSERSGFSEDARAYNEIVTSWSAIEAAEAGAAGPRQAALFDA